MLAAALRTARLNARPHAPTARGFARLTIVGHLGADPEIRTTKTDRQYMSYIVATKGRLPPPAPDGTRQEPTTTWHRVYAFNESQAEYLQKLTKGSLVYVEAEYELREPVSGASPDSPEAQRQVFLRQEKIMLLKRSERSGERE
ncbi:nucleic acid-binding protein [Ceratobasidium sp. AG-Ba]|nr:nucleic acid-binding protein [Ceratobasidium sp. AG-Ba]